MAEKTAKNNEKDRFLTRIRKKLGLTQEEFSVILGASRAHYSLAELGKRNLPAAAGSLVASMNLQFHELETGARSDYRSLETRLFLNDAYKKTLPVMERLERDCRRELKILKEKLQAMKLRARETEHAIIVFSMVIADLEGQPDNNTKAIQSRQLEGLRMFKQKLYDNLLGCWEPEQAKLHARIEALAGEAKALRRYRTKVLKEHSPFGKKTPRAKR